MKRRRGESPGGRAQHRCPGCANVHHRVDRGDPASAINQLTAFQNQVQAQVQPLDASLAASLNQAAHDTIDSLNEALANPGSPSHGQFEFDDAQAGSFGQRFYRLVLP